MSGKYLFQAYGRKMIHIWPKMESTAKNLIEFVVNAFQLLSSQAYYLTVPMIV